MRQKFMLHIYIYCIITACYTSEVTFVSFLSHSSSSTILKYTHIFANYQASFFTEMFQIQFSKNN
jgi:hypothetical protein